MSCCNTREVPQRHPTVDSVSATQYMENEKASPCRAPWFWYASWQVDMVDATVENILRGVGVDITTHSQLRPGVDLYRVPGGERAVSLWQLLRQQATGLQGWPVIIGAESEVAYMTDRANEVDVQKCLASVPTGSPVSARREATLAKLQAMLRSYQTLGIPVPDFFNDLIARCSAPKSDAMPSPPPDMVDWCLPEASRPETIWSAYAAPDDPLESCVLAVVHDAAPADVPAYIGFGGFNSCPPPNVHVAFLRDWQRRFGAVPAAVTHDVIELFVPRPIATAADAWTVACEHGEYCGEDTAIDAERALRIWQSPYWYFWWD